MYRWIVEAVRMDGGRRRALLMAEPAQEPVGAGLSFGTLVGRQQVHVGHGAALAQLLRRVAVARLAQADEDGRQRQDRLQRSERHQHGVDDDRPLP